MEESTADPSADLLKEIAKNQSSAADAADAKAAELQARNALATGRVQAGMNTVASVFNMLSPLAQEIVKDALTGMGW